VNTEWRVSQLYYRPPKGEGDQQNSSPSHSLASPLTPALSQRERELSNLRRRIKMIEHQVNYHSSDGDIQPKRQREARDGLVAEEVSALGAAHGDDYEGNDDCGQE